MNRIIQIIQSGPSAFFALCSLALLLAGLPTIAPAAEAAGKVAAASGQVTAAGKDGAIRSLTVDTPVFAGDIINTGPNSKVRIVFSDEGVIFLRPSSRFIIDSYQHAGSAKDESKFSLVRGGFRAVTGAIGQTNKENVKINTPVATIGIRGTDHEGRFCAGDCFDLANIGVSAPPDGLYTGTNVGRTQVGRQQFRPGEYGFTTLKKITVRLPDPPPILVSDPHLKTGLVMKSQEPEKKPDTAPKQETKQEEKKPEQAQKPAQAAQPAATEQGQQSGGGQATGPSQPAQGEPKPQGSPMVLEIPAQPQTVRTIQCF